MKIILPGTVTGCRRLGATRGRAAPVGFTLVELLVVIALSALLAALLLPAIGRGPRLSRRAVCASNLRQVGLALACYLDEEGSYPLATAGDGLGCWQRALRVYASSNTFFCAEKVRVADEYVALFSLPSPKIGLHYGYNQRGAARKNLPKDNLGLGGDYRYEEGKGRFVPSPESRVQAPCRMLAVGDSDANIVLPSALAAAPPYADLLHLIFPHTVLPFGEPGVGRWHDGGANMLFCDSHVEHRKTERWTAATDEARSSWNNDSLPHPETW
jgi:prepilin-type processing-associated H-X9-DG protein/prepilin-type N-terminal cleavage/methylation domain-containing protein